VEIFLLIAAFGSVDLLRIIFKRTDTARLESRAATFAVVGAWVAVSALLATTNTHRHYFRNDNDAARAAASAIQDPTTCGIAVPKRTYWQFGYALLHSNKPVFLIGTQDEVTRAAPGPAEHGFNRMLVWANEPGPPVPWVKRSCSGQPLEKQRSCLYVRPGGCRVDDSNRGLLYQETLLANDM
jgi:hypothetical protein